jgi:hypothetical protein
MDTTFGTAMLQMQKTQDCQSQRTLAAPALTDQAKHFATFQLQGDITENA